MSCLRFKYDRDVGPCSNVLIGSSGFFKDQTPSEIDTAIKEGHIRSVPLLFDTGADRTVIRPDIPATLGIQTTGRLEISTPAGTSYAQTYNLVVGLFLGNQIIWKETQVPEFRGHSQYYYGLLGRDFLQLGVFQICWDGTAIFCV